MKTKFAIVFGAILLLAVAVCAQEYPKGEAGFDYSYARYAPSASYTKGHSLNGGGGWAVYNFNEYFGIKMDLQGYGSNHTGFTIPAGVSKNFPGGGTGNVQGNLFTYLFGPQVKVRSHSVQPFGHLLFGGAHTNVYGNAFQTICQPIAGGCAFSTRPAGDAFALAFGGGIDIPIHKHIQFRPAEIDYLYTRFTNQFTNAGQNNFRYQAGVNFTFGDTTHN